MLKIVPWHLTLMKDAQYYLFSNFHEAMFLIEASRRQSQSSTDQVTKIILSADEIMGVFSMNTNGRLLVHIDPEILNEESCEQILDHVVSEPFPISGMLGNWHAVSSLATCLVYNGIWSKLRMISEEATMVLDQIGNIDIEFQDNIRLLDSSDFAAWYQLRLAYCHELNIPISESLYEIQKSFALATQQERHWGLFIDGRLIAISSANAIVDNTAQVGGVYTSEDHRSKGYARRLISRQLEDLRMRSICRASLFTGKDNHAAIKAYEQLGFVAKGHFGLVFPALPS
ncbi:GNAT family N-acetyltransferase [Pseudobacteriovorax antillogorgiicola]|uniref:Acetyltransferase (GNAT) family protein n=1 Tax=Pseudobacteriovorax antillogorgiicola TaxID=1513793 RepID=A0A1Y6C7W2_9BACT|nr:GNAT family N-acetyltransferase [Pseudobacteriovorax antillogorgiicola]TCS51732.1 acetyltransferase (GNAT) family protein [Pseudobacteriovorax antillogorgiicola]SMF49569.1 Acetyltransferase (GNAT) family protein [Pseudobacteriovorax antillogorgiicola]